MLDGHTAITLEQELGDMFNDSNTRVIFDLAALTYVASAGIGLFISSRQRITEAGGKMELFAPSSAVQEIFAIIGLNDLFRADHEVAALAAITAQAQL